MKNKCILVDEDDYSKFIDICEKNDISASSVIRRLISEVVHDYKFYIDGKFTEQLLKKHVDI